MGYDPATDFKLTALPNIGDRELLESTFGVECFNSYGFHEVQWVSVECPAHDGLHIFEDAFVVQIVDPETGELLPDGEQGSICITELYKTGSPQFRYNIMDLSTLYPREQCSCGSWLRKMAPFAGRADNMVKLRGVNVWPEAVGAIALEVAGAEADWFVRAVRDGEPRRARSSRSPATATPSHVRGARGRDRDEAQGPPRRRRSPPRWWRPARSTRGPRWVRPPS